MKKMKWQLLILALLCLVALSFLLFLVKKGPAAGHLTLTVLDAYSLQPVENAFVCLPESNRSMQTGQNGTAVFRSIPIEKESVPRRIPTKEYGETTILVYAEGYLPFALFHAQVFPEKMRNGPTLYLFPNDTEDGIRVVPMIESPSEEWVEKLLEQYKP